jgi:hypothetical protein
VGSAVGVCASQAAVTECGEQATAESEVSDTYPCH